MKVFLFLMVCGVSLFAEPSWYRQLADNNPSKYIGYGEGQSRAEAVKRALNEISSKISISVSVGSSSSQRNTNGKFEKKSEHISVQKSAAVIKDWTELKQSLESGTYYIAIEYEKIPSLNKFVKKVIARKGDGSFIDTTQNSYLKHTPMASKLKKHFKQDINFELFRDNRKWSLKYGDTTQELDNKDFAKFFTSVDNKDLHIALDRNRRFLFDGETFYFKIKSTNAGFISVLTVYEDGTVATLVRNIAVKKNAKENIPDKDFEAIPEAGLIKPGVETYDLYVVIYSNKKIKFDSFAYADSSLINEEKYKNFDELIEILDGQEYTTLKVVTKPKIH